MEVDQPRFHHYTFAHYALRTVAFQHPLGVMGILASPEAKKFLAELLDKVSEHGRDQGESADFTVDDIQVHPCRAGAFPCALVEMPEPRGVTETYFTAIVLLVDPTNLPEVPSELPIRYFTLEKGFSLDGVPRTVLCEWDKAGTHLNYGDGPAAERAAFVQAVARMVAAKEGAAGALSDPSPKPPPRNGEGE